MSDRLETKELREIRKQFMHAGFSLGFACTTNRFNSEATDDMPFNQVSEAVDAAFELAYVDVLKRMETPK